MSWVIEKQAITLPPCGVIENMSPTTLKRSANFAIVSSCRWHQSVISGNYDLLQISDGSEWESLSFGLTCPPFYNHSGGQFQYSLVVVNKHASQLLCAGVVATTDSDVLYASLSQDKSYGYQIY
jgi:hypothetical protein